MQRRFRLVGMSEVVLERTVCGVAVGAERDYLSGGCECAGESVWRAVDAVHRPGGSDGGEPSCAGDYGDGEHGSSGFCGSGAVGDLLILKASVNRAFRTSMEVGVKAMVEDVREQRLRHVSSAYLTYVAVDQEGKRTGGAAGCAGDGASEAAIRGCRAAARDAGG